VAHLSAPRERHLEGFTLQRSPTEEVSFVCALNLGIYESTPGFLRQREDTCDPAPDQGALRGDFSLFLRLPPEEGVSDFHNAILQF